ncbi:transporter [Thioalkalivibrio sp. XN279]|uniref:transporter n=1 Tax=Thioalkalivibrio sp. XN279 TaxID=2714953 RepID=UPI00140A2F78|nr:transporter [Thioalkalivibrio sp. XN279]NHA15054.1 transporter [Thioalkalivibrio sp. XN279]
MSRTRHHVAPICAVLLGATAATTPALATESEQELARQLTNPVAALISVPLQLNYNSNIGPVDDGEQWVLNLQPVIPFSLNDDWNLISRTILPIVDQSDIFPGAGSQSGIGDTVQSVFFSPKAPTADGWIWGAGPVFLLPTGSDDLLTTDKWGIGPTGVALRQQGQWTVGVLANHIWSFAGESARDDINATFIQPFMSFTTPTAWTYTLQSESTYDWEGSDWQIPVRGVVSKVTRVGNQLMSVAGGVNYWVQSTDRGPEGWGFRFTVTLLFPR